MKKFFCFTIVLLPFFSIAQQKQKKIGIAIQVNTVNDLSYLAQNISINSTPGTVNNNSYSLSIKGNYHLKNNLVLQLKISKTQRSSSFYSDSREDDISTTPPSLNHSQIFEILQNSSTQSDLVMALGLYYLYRLNKFELIGGINLEGISHGKAKSRSSREQVQVDTTATQIETADILSTGSGIFPGGISVGVESHVGLNYYLANYISIGFEISNEFLYTKIGNTSNATGTYTQTYNSNPPATSYSSYTYPQSYKSFDLCKPIGSLNIIYWF